MPTTTTETLHSVRFTGPTVIERGQPSVITAPVWLAGALVAPASGTVTIYDDSNTVIVSAAAVTITSSIATYTVLAATTTSLTPAEGWRVVWTLNLTGGEQINAATDAVLALRRIRPVVTDNDLIRYHPELDRLRPSTEASYQDYLDSSWLEIESRLIGSGKRPWLIISAHSLRNIHLYATLALVYRDFATGGSGSREWDLAEKYSTQAAAEWDRLTLVTGDASTGEIDGGSRRKAGQPTIWLCSRGSSL